MIYACHCLCAVSHPEQQGVCVSEPASRWIRFGPPPDYLAFESFLNVNREDVLMCDPCANATLACRR